MSYDPDPEWTTDIVLPKRDDVRCPTCNQTPFHTDIIMERLIQPSYYYPRHIPPALTFTCDNIECPNCDNDFEVRLSVIVSIK